MKNFIILLLLCITFAQYQKYTELREDYTNLIQAIEEEIL